MGLFKISFSSMLLLFSAETPPPGHVLQNMTYLVEYEPPDGSTEHYNKEHIGEVPQTVQKEFHKRHEVDSDLPCV